MTVMHRLPDEAAAEGRHDLAVDLTDLAVWLEANSDAELPDGRTLSKRVYGLTHGDRLAELDRIAASWDVQVETMRTGAKLARRTFGSVTLAATVSPPDATLADHYARIAQRTETAA